LGRLFITPALHRWHHAQRWTDLNTNFGTIFVIWDRCFGTHHPSSSIIAVPTGLPGVTEPRTFLRAMLLPLDRLSAYGSGRRGGEGEGRREGEAEAGASVVNDPVWGMRVAAATAKGGAFDYEGHTYYFCNSRCREKFRDAPERYLTASTAPPVVAASPPAAAE